MRTQSRRLLRTGAVAGLVMTALPLAHGPLSAVQHASAARMDVQGFSPALVSAATIAPQKMIFLLRASQQPAALLHTLRQTGATDIQSLDLVHGVAAQVTARTLNTLRYNPALLEMAVDHQYQALPTPDGALLAAQVARAGLQENAKLPPGVQPIQQPDTLHIIHADTAQQRFNGSGVRIAIVDSGVDYGHPDLAGIMLKNAAGKPLYADFTGTDLTDTVGHGTAVAGVIAAQARTVYAVNNTYRTAVYPLANPTKRFDTTTYFTVGGVAPGAKIMVAKIFDARLPGGGGYDSSIVRAIQWAIANHADIISESFGQTAVVQTNSATDIVALADEEAVRHGITVVAADGNSGPGVSSVSSPAQAPDVIAVGASTDYQAFAQTGYLMNYNSYTADNILSFTSRGPTYDGRIRPDVFAPGGWGWSTVPRTPSQERSATPPYLLEQFGGTSMATPVVAGTAALVIEAYMHTHGGQRPSPAYVKQILTSTADNLGYPAADQAAGRVDAQRAIDAVTHSGPSVLTSGALALKGLAGDRPSQTIALTNTGSTVEHLSLTPQLTATARVVRFSGTTVANDFYTFSFKVPAGIARLSAATFWDNQKLQDPQPDTSQVPVAMIIRLYDPHGNFVNYNGSGTNGAGNVVTTAGRPVPGTWTAVISQRTTHDNNQVSHYVNIPFRAQITMDRFVSGGGTVSPSSLTLKPGQHRRVTFTADRLLAAGSRIVTLHMDESVAGSTVFTPTGTVQTIPVVVTTAVTMAQGRGTFRGAFSGADDQGFDEVDYYPFTVPAATRNIALTVTWPHPGNWFLAALLDPQGRTYNLVDNALQSSSSGSAASGPIDLASTAPPTGKPDLSQHEIDAFVHNPVAGQWRVELINYQFAGTQSSEPYIGHIQLNRTLARLDHSAISVQAGGAAVPFRIAVTNPYGGEQAYFTYDTTDTYSYIALGGSGGTLQNGPLGIGSTQVLTYSTDFVPPGTREIISQAQALHSAQLVGVSISDPVLLTFTHFGQPAPQALGGVLGQGEAAVVSAPSLPIGRWQATLNLPTSARTGPVYVAGNTIGYSLLPSDWISTDAQLQQDGLINASGLPVALSGQTITLHGSVKVPQGVAPGTYAAHIFVYSFREDELADLPLTIHVAGVAPTAAPTPDPVLAANVSNQYFAEGATGAGVTTQLDMVNPGTQDAHAQVKVLTATGWTSVMRYNLQPHSRKTINLQSLVGANQMVATEVQGDEPIVSGRQIARSGVSGTYSVGTLAPSTHWYFADGYTVSPFQDFITVVNPTDHTAQVHIHVVSDQGTTADGSFSLAPANRRTMNLSDVMDGKALSTTVSSNVVVVAERTENFGTSGQGVTTTVGATEGASSSYLDPGHLPAGSQGHIAMYNPYTQTAHVAVTLLNRAGAPVHSLAVTIKPGRRANIDLSATYGTVSLGALIHSDAPVVVEKVGYFGNFKQSQIGGSDIMAVAAPAAHLVFPGGTTAKGASDYLSLYNPGKVASQALITVLYDGSNVAHHAVIVPADTRIGVSINALGLPAGASSVLVDTADGTQLYGTQSLFNAAHTDGSEVTGVAIAGS